MSAASQPWTVAEAAAYWGVTPSWVTAMIRRGEVCATQEPRVIRGRVRCKTRWIIPVEEIKRIAELRAGRWPP